MAELAISPTLFSQAPDPVYAYFIGRWFARCRRHAVQPGPAVAEAELWMPVALAEKLPSLMVGRSSAIDVAYLSQRVSS